MDAFDMQSAVPYRLGRITLHLPADWARPRSLGSADDWSCWKEDKSAELTLSVSGYGGADDDAAREAWLAGQADIFEQILRQQGFAAEVHRSAQTQGAGLMYVSFGEGEVRDPDSGEESGLTFVDAQTLLSTGDIVRVAMFTGLGEDGVGELVQWVDAVLQSISLVDHPESEHDHGHSHH